MDLATPDFLSCPFDEHKIQLADDEWLTYWSAGDRCDHSGKPRAVVVALHGLRDAGRSLIPIAHALAEQFYVVLPDLRGHGDSVQPGCYAIAHFLMDLRRVIRDVGAANVSLIGHSLGGHICARYAGIFTQDIDSLIIIEGLGPPLANAANTGVSQPTTSPAPPVFTPAEEDPMHLAQRIDDAITTAEIAREPRVMPNLKFARDRLQKNNPGLASAFAEYLSECLTVAQANGEPAVRWRFDARAQEVFLGISHNRGRDYWRRIAAPTLIVFGDRGHDYWRSMRNQPNYDGRYSSADLQDRLACFQQVEYQIIADAGHQLHYDQPVQLAQSCANFLDQQRSS